MQLVAAWPMAFFDVLAASKEKLEIVFGLLWNLRKFECRFTKGLKTGDKALVDLGSSEIVYVDLDGRCCRLEGLCESIVEVRWGRPLQE